MKNLVLITQVGLSLAIPIIVGVLLGGFIDKRLKTGWIFSIIFLFLGIVSGFYNTYKLIMSLNKPEKGEEIDGK